MHNSQFVIAGSRMSLPVVTCHNRPSEALYSGCGFLQAALQAAPLLAWSCPQYAISDGTFALALAALTPTCERALCGGVGVSAFSLGSAKLYQMREWLFWG